MSPHLIFTIRSFLCAGCALSCLMAAGHALLAAGNAQQSIELLQEHGIAPDRDGLTAYFDSLELNENSRSRISGLLKQLGDEDFFKREAAMYDLVKMPILAPDLLQSAVEGDDPEVRWRALEVQRKADQRSNQLIFAAYNVVKEQKLTGLTAPLLKSVRFCREDYLRVAAERAMRVTAEQADIPFVASKLSAQDAATQQAAILLLEHLAGSEADDSLRPLLSHENPQTRLVAARAFLNHGSRDGLAPLIDLLSEDDLRIRGRSAQTLREATRQRLPFVAYDTIENRAAQAKLWHDWVSQQGATATLTFPLTGEAPQLGRTLLCSYSTRKVIELDERGKEIWSKELTGAWGCDGTPDGHRVIAFHTTRTIAEYDAVGKEIWKVDNVPGRPFSVQRLDDGNSLVGCYDTGVIAEIAPSKKVVWQITVQGQPMDTRRIENGNTLVALYQTGSVVEFDRNGKEVWSLKNVAGPRSVQRLDNGNTLVCETNRAQVTEYSPEQQVVWSQAGLPNPLDAQRLPNGNTLVAYSQGVREIDSRGKTIWEFKLQGVSSVCRY